MPTVADRLVDLRTRAALTRNELAHLAELSQSLIGHIERGTRPHPSAKTLTQLARVFGCKFAYLFSGQGDPPADRSLRKALADAKEAAAAREASKGAA